MTSIENLSPFNFLSVCDVSFDIQEQLQMTEENVVWIPIVRDVIRWQLLYPVNGINHRDNYGDARNRGIRYLKNNGHILDFSFKFSDHRWMTRIKVEVDRKKFDDFYQKLVKVYEKRVVEPNKTEEQKKAEQELEKLKDIEAQLKDVPKNPEKYEKVRQENIKRKKEELEEIYSSIDYASKAERKAWEKKWNVLQVLWSAYISANRLASIRIPKEKLTIDISISEVEVFDVLNGLQEKEEV
jgi:alpha-galactosidase/6-phospho-beta-glucosidase family protein